MTVCWHKQCCLNRTFQKPRSGPCRNFPFNSSRKESLSFSLQVSCGGYFRQFAVDYAGNFLQIPTEYLKHFGVTLNCTPYLSPPHLFLQVWTQLLWWQEAAWPVSELFTPFFSSTPQKGKSLELLCKSVEEPVRFPHHHHFHLHEGIIKHCKWGWMEGFSSTSVGSAWLRSVGNIQQGANREGMLSWGAFPRRERGQVSFPGQLGQSLFQAAPFAVAVGSAQGQQRHRLLEVGTLRL